MVSKKEKSLNQLLNSEKMVYDEFVKSRGKPRLDFGAIYLTRPNEKGISNLVVIIDLFEDDDRFYNKYVNVFPISTDTDFANDEDLIIEGIEKNGPLPCDILIHAGMQMTISIEDIVDYYAHLSKVHEKMLKEFLLLIQGDYSIDIEKFSIGSPIISQIDFRVEHRNFIIGEFEYLTIPAFVSVSNYINKQRQEQVFKQQFEPRNFRDYVNFISHHCGHEEKNQKLYYKYFINALNNSYENKAKGDLDKLKELYKKGYKIIEQPLTDDRRRPDFVIEDEYGNKKEFEIKNDKLYEIKKGRLIELSEHLYDNIINLKHPELAIEKGFIIELYEYNYKRYLKRLNDNIKKENIDKAFENINEWATTLLPRSDIENPYAGTLEWMVHYALGNIDGLKDVNEELKNLAQKKRNHFDVDNAITITNGRILQLEGKLDLAIKQYQKIDTKNFMIKSVFTDPLIGCYSKLGDNFTARELANKNSRPVKKRGEWGYKAHGDQLWISENITAAEFLQAS
jgi:hypothetical protein